MKTESIQALIADPRIDPTSWVGKALIQWIKENINECLEDPVAREYIVQGMEWADLEPVANAIVHAYQQSRDIEIIDNFVNRVNKVVAETYASNGNVSYYGRDWKVKGVVSSLESVANENNIYSILNFKIPSGYNSNPNNLAKHMEFEHLPKFLENRKPIWNNSYYWDMLIRKIPRQELFNFFTKTIYPHIKRHVDKVYSNWSRELQNILFKMIIRLPAEDAHRWNQWFSQLNVVEHYYYRKGWFSKGYHPLEIYFDDKVCRCGFVAKTRSGIAGHVASCMSVSTYEGMGLHLATKLFLSKDESSLICNKCGRSCKSKSGHSLHYKKCESIRGEKFSDWRLAEQLRMEVEEKKHEYKQASMEMSGQTNQNVTRLTSVL